MKEIRTYRGQGTLVFNENSKIPCKFECIQWSNAWITCHCLIDEIERHTPQVREAFWEFKDAKCLEGQTENGFELVAHDLQQGSTPKEPGITAGQPSYTLFIFRAREISVQTLGKSCLMRFGLTNFEFFLIIRVMKWAKGEYRVMLEAWKTTSQLRQ
ncbi:MAG: hypothetical protein JXB47_05060, partial [Anaerolineae bacterium]|nr:hypothetical protein [Anaerolineae bacterium]